MTLASAGEGRQMEEVSIAVRTVLQLQSVKCQWGADASRRRSQPGLCEYARLGVSCFQIDHRP